MLWPCSQNRLEWFDILPYDTSMLLPLSHVSWSKNLIFTNLIYFLHFPIVLYALFEVCLVV